jgi:hypothetical protein
VELVQIHDTSNGHLHEEERAVNSLLSEGEKHVHFWAAMNMFQGDTLTFTASDPAAVGIDPTTDTKRVLITENYGV